MAINRESNGYTFVFAIIMVIVVGGLLAFIAGNLKPIQKANVKNEKKQNILSAIGLEQTKGFTRETAGDAFPKFVKRRLTIDFAGNILSDYASDKEIDDKDPLDAFNVDLRKEYSLYVKPLMNKHKGDPEALKRALSASKDIHLPVFLCESNGEQYMVLSCSGKGLWDDIWGYIGLKSDGRTINGAVFDHKAETPGLGSKITEDWFTKQFVGKTIADESGEFTSIEVLKPGKDLNNHQVDGISGATFTGVGVDEMITRNFMVYHSFLSTKKLFN